MANKTDYPRPWYGQVKATECLFKPKDYLRPSVIQG